MEPNCPSPCGSMLPSVPSALCRWRAGRPLQPQQRQALGSTYCHLGGWELTGPRRPSGDQSGCSWMAEPSPHSSKHLAGTRQHPSVTFSAGLPPRGLSGRVCFILINVSTIYEVSLLCSLWLWSSLWSVGFQRRQGEEPWMQTAGSSIPLPPRDELPLGA